MRHARITVQARVFINKVKRRDSSCLQCSTSRRYHKNGTTVSIIKWAHIAFQPTCWLGFDRWWFERLRRFDYRSSQARKKTTGEEVLPSQYAYNDYKTAVAKFSITARRPFLFVLVAVWILMLPSPVTSHVFMSSLCFHPSIRFSQGIFPWYSAFSATSS